MRHMLSGTWRKWLNEIRRTSPKRKQPSRRASSKLTLEMLEQRITPRTDQPNTTTDFAFTNVDPATGAITAGASVGSITLRSAIFAANAHAGTDTINIPAGTYTLAVTGTEGTFIPDDSIN